MIDELKPLIKKLTIFAKTNLNFKMPPRLFLKKDSENQKCMLGKTAHYDPAEKSITVFISGRHPKDILRSYTHELVHHCQNEKGQLSPEKMKTLNKNYAQENEHMRKMEQQAYLFGNMCFRDWEDSLDNKMQYTMRLAEQKFLKENNNMSVKLSKKVLKSLLEKLLKEAEKKEKVAGYRKVEEGGESDELEEGSCGKAEDQKDDPMEEGSCGKGTRKDQEKDPMEEGTDDNCPVCDSPMSIGDHDHSLEEIAAVEEKKRKGGKIPKTAKEKKFAKLAPPKNRITFADKIAGATQVAEERIQTPEQEKNLYEQRFTPKNTRLFEKLLKEWTK